ncbi:MAG: hypothetical protein GEU71_10695 [Actinobacteria bacterium]|nr:hypothetical protein [Actinomycetota bacterium]
MMASEGARLEFELILEALNRREVQYVVIGSVAALVQGAPLVRTLDVDVTPAGDPENKQRLALALVDVEARLRAPGLADPMKIPLDEGTFSGMTTMTFATRHGPLDLCFMPEGTSGYEDLSKDALPIEINGIEFRVASIADIVRSKKAAGREKDAAHVEILSDLLEGRP